MKSLYLKVLTLVSVSTLIVYLLISNLKGNSYEEIVNTKSLLETHLRDKLRSENYSKDYISYVESTLNYDYKSLKGVILESDLQDLYKYHKKDSLEENIFGFNNYLSEQYNSTTDSFYKKDLTNLRNLTNIILRSNSN